jgi:hypothetical protein
MTICISISQIVNFPNCSYTDKRALIKLNLISADAVLVIKCSDCFSTHIFVFESSSSSVIHLLACLCTLFEIFSLTIYLSRFQLLKTHFFVLHFSVTCIQTLVLSYRITYRSYSITDILYIKIH